MDFNKNKLMEAVISKYMDTWAKLIDTDEFVKDKYLKRIDVLIYANLRKKLKEINIYELLYLESKGIKLNILKRLRILFSGLRSVYEMEQKELARKQQEKEERAKTQPKKKKRKKKVVKE